MNTNRDEAFQVWLKSLFLAQNNVEQSYSIEALTGDAGFRKYFRIKTNNRTYIGVDAEPTKSNNPAFIQISKAILNSGVNAPEVIYQDDQQGFFCLTDFGDRLLSDAVTNDNMYSLYENAIDALIELLSIERIADYPLPIYDDKFVATELSIFPEWLLKEHLNISLDNVEKEQLRACFKLLIDNATEQPRYFMHRDYHSRNLMLVGDDLNKHEIGVIDFQDAVSGPITYDIVSLLRDCYIKWPSVNVETMFSYFKKSVSQRFNLNISEAQWQRWFDLMGIQRHIKASGIFARLNHRDNKSGYLADIPLTLTYIVEISEKYPELNFLRSLILNKVLPALNKLDQTQGKHK